jgi:hypothetical protein
LLRLGTIWGHYSAILILLANQKRQGADLDPIPLMELDILFDLFFIDESAVGAMAIVDDDLVALGTQLAVPVTNVRIGGPELAVVVSSHSEGGRSNGNDGSFALPSIDHKSPFHVAPPGHALMIESGNIRALLRCRTQTPKLNLSRFGDEGK